MRIGALRPVGERVSVFPASPRSPNWPPQYSATWFESGTAALALAVKLAVRLKRVSRPTVVVPAYTCPDVVSAVRWAGALPLVVDTRPDSPWLDLESVRKALFEQTVAVVAPHFLGLRQPLHELADVCRQHDAFLIEDSAQLSVASSDFAASGDFVVLSFGRGKPIPAQGGVLLYRDRFSALLQPSIARIDAVTSSGLRWRAAVALQNAAFTRVGYRLARSVPLLRIGETRFRALERVRRKTGKSNRLAERVIAGWEVDPLPQQLILEKIVSSSGIVTSLPSQLGWNRTAPLLRFPVLANRVADRDRLVRQLSLTGIEATALYGVPLCKIRDMPMLECCGPAPHAADFASRLLTLPAHSGVRDRDLAKIEGVLQFTSRTSSR